MAAPFALWTLVAAGLGISGYALLTGDTTKEKHWLYAAIAYDRAARYVFPDKHDLIASAHLDVYCEESGKLIRSEDFTDAFIEWFEKNKDDEGTLALTWDEIRQKLECCHDDDMVEILVEYRVGETYIEQVFGVMYSSENEGAGLLFPVYTQEELTPQPGIMMVQRSLVFAGIHDGENMQDEEDVTDLVHKWAGPRSNFYHDTPYRNTITLDAMLWDYDDRKQYLRITDTWGQTVVYNRHVHCTIDWPADAAPQPPLWAFEDTEADFPEEPSGPFGATGGDWAAVTGATGCWSPTATAAPGTPLLTDVPTAVAFTENETSHGPHGSEL